MISFRFRMKGKMPMVLLMLTLLLSSLLSTKGLLSNPTTSFLTSHAMISGRRGFSMIRSRPSTRCESKSDQSLETGTDEDEDYVTKAERKTETARTRESKSPDRLPPESLSIQTGLFATLLFVGFWPLLALLRSTTSPIDGFDVDMFMALKGIMDTAPMTDMDSTIVELPALSPAEQLVGAIFGPPQ